MKANLISKLKNIGDGDTRILAGYEDWKFCRFSRANLTSRLRASLEKVYEISLFLSYEVYRIIFWRLPSSRIPGVPIYDVYLMFWLCLPAFSYTLASEIPVLFLTIERIISLRYNDNITCAKKSKNLTEFIKINSIF